MLCVYKPFCIWLEYNKMHDNAIFKLSALQTLFLKLKLTSLTTVCTKCKNREITSFWSNLRQYFFKWTFMLSLRYKLICNCKSFSQTHNLDGLYDNEIWIISQCFVLKVKNAKLYKLFIQTIYSVDIRDLKLNYYVFIPFQELLNFKSFKIIFI